MIETLLNKFEFEGIAIQITLDIGKPVTVHAFDWDGHMYMESAETIVDALEKMKIRILG